MQPLLVISVVIAVLCTRCVEGQSDMRSSITFVIDSTGSMHDDIAAVKSQIKSIFDTVKNSNTSQIEDFILVEFNDPSDTIVRTITSDETTFKKELDLIKIYGGGDCPERALDGIAKALEVSKPGSYIYVFTDADANDRSKVEAVKSVAIEKGCRIVFLLTGSCSRGYDPTYHQLAEATKGIIFPLNKNEVSKVLNYVRETVKSRKDVIVEKKLPAGDHKLDYLVDSNMKELIVTVTGKNPKVHLYDPYGDEAEVEEVARTSMVAIVKVVEVKPGVYTANIHSDEKSSVAVSGTSTMHFVHGFSRLEPTAIEETTRQPYPDEKSYLSVKVNVEGGAIQLHGIEIIDLDGNVIIEKTLDLVNRIDQFYSTEEAFLLPDKPFRIAIKGFDVETKSIITRYGLTTIEPQKRKTVSIANKAPVVAVIGRSNFLLESEDFLQLKCRVSAYPKPTITWTDDAGNKIGSNETQIEIPYDYVSVVDLDSKDMNNATFTCKASNDLGVDSKNFEVKIKRTKFFDIVETPSDAEIEYDHEAIFRCKVDAGPQPAQITWFFKRKPIRESLHYVVSEDGTALIIKAMKPYLDGRFSCIAKNNWYKKVFRFHVTTTGIEKPIIDKNVTEIRAIQGQSATITCSLLQGVPKPNIRWWFKPKYTDGIKQLSSEETIISFKKVAIANAGTYRCEASNDADTDYGYKDLNVEYPPTILRRNKRQISAIEGNPVKLPCDVLGEPQPDVKWYLNGAEVTKAKHIHLLKTNSLRFKATVDLSGNFTCKARNYLGAVESEPVVVSVTIPVNIQTPDKSSYEVPVGSDLSLNCISDGYPQPEISWSFNNLKFSAPAKTLKPQSDGSLQLPRLQVSQEGYYTCTAKNIGSTANITYTVNIVAPPKIINSRPDKTYAAVLGDLTLRVPCSTLGTPTPTIVWKKNGFNVATGNEWYDLEADGTLVIKNIDNKSKGAYECLARNHLGYDTDIYNIDIIDTPKTGVPTKKVELAEDGTSHIPCNVPHTSVDLLRWFKDGKEIRSGELTLRNVTRADTGLYTCRVSNFLKSVTGNTEVVVGYKPKFLTNPATKIEYLDGNMAVLDCSGAAHPTPTVEWSYKNKRLGKTLKETEMVYRLKMKPESVGTYFCSMKNQYGHVIRQFKIESKDCALNIAKDFGAHKPVIKSIEPRTKFDVRDGYMQIPQNHTVKLTCSDAFENFVENEVLATCIEGTRFDFNGVEYKYKDIKCNDVFEPVVIETNNHCIEVENDLLKVGYEVNDEFNEVYEICWDKYRNIPIYSKQNMDKSLANIDLKKTQKWFNSDVANFDLDLMYDCYTQIDWISSILGKEFIPKENVCFAQRQLVNSRDVSPGLSQVSTYMDVNVIPLWGSYSAKNWELVEKKIRILAMSTDRELTVWTGISKSLNLEGHRRDITITDNGEHVVYVPKYIWKVVEDPVKRSSLAIVQVNVPDIRPAHAHKYVKCRDICREVKWMHSKTWRNANRGLVYCCSIQDFMGSFGFQELFRGVSEDVLR